MQAVGINEETNTEIAWSLIGGALREVQLLEGKVEGKRLVGRRQNSWLKDLRRWFRRTNLSRDIQSGGIEDDPGHVDRHPPNGEGELRRRRKTKKQMMKILAIMTSPLRYN